MKLFGWALILAGGGLAVVGLRKLLAPPAEPGDPDYDPGDDMDAWEQHLTKAEQEAVDHACDYHDLNDGA